VGGTLVSTQTGKLSTIADTQSTGNLGVGYLNTHWQGQIAEVIVYTVALTDSQRQQVEQYLKTKYGL
jgi:Spy/CpxP family protein refolding chaperone